MNFAAFERAQVAAFAYREARFTGSLDCMRAVCFVLRNRVKSSWSGGSWLAVMEQAHLTAATNDLGCAVLSTGSGLNGAGAASDRLLQLMVKDVDDIYLSQESYDDPVRMVTEGARPGISSGIVAKKDWHPALYYSFVDQASRMRPWFVENIIRRPEEHGQMGQIGKMMLYR